MDPVEIMYPSAANVRNNRTATNRETKASASARIVPRLSESVYDGAGSKFPMSGGGGDRSFIDTNRGQKAALHSPDVNVEHVNPSRQGLTSFFETVGFYSSNR